MRSCHPTCVGASGHPAIKASAKRQPMPLLMGDRTRATRDCSTQTRHRCSLSSLSVWTRRRHSDRLRMAGVGKWRACQNPTRVDTAMPQASGTRRRLPASTAHAHTHAHHVFHRRLILALLMASGAIIFCIIWTAPLGPASARRPGVRGRDASRAATLGAVSAIGALSFPQFRHRATRRMVGP